MLGRLILLFLLTPAVELALLIQVDQVIGFWPTVGLIIITGIVGSHLARREGLSTWQRLNRLVAGALLINPGILTDVFGFLGLVPFSRAYLRRFVMRWFQRKMEQGTMQVQFGAFGGAAPGGPSSAGPSPGPSPAGQGSSAESPWRGQGQQVPDHAEEASDRSSPKASPS